MEMFKMFETLGIFPIVIFIFMFGITGFILSRVVKAWRGYQYNSMQPQQTAPARVVDKRTAFRASTTAHHHGAGGTHGRTYYFVTFEFQNGDRKEFSVTANGYGLLTAADSGDITYQGNWLLQFARQDESGRYVIENKPQRGTFWGLIFISLFLVVFIIMVLFIFSRFLEFDRFIFGG